MDNITKSYAIVITILCAVLIYALSTQVQKQEHNKWLIASDGTYSIKIRLPDQDGIFRIQLKDKFLIGITSEGNAYSFIETFGEPMAHFNMSLTKKLDNGTYLGGSDIYMPIYLKDILLNNKDFIANFSEIIQEARND